MKKISKYFLIVIILMVITLTGCKKKYNVVFDLNGGSASYSNISILKNETVQKPIDPIKNGYVFKGFYLDDKIFDFSTKITSDITLTAKWEKMHLVKFDVDGEIIKQEIENGKTLDIPTNPTKENAKFKGWYLDDEEFDFSTIITKDIVLVAKWDNIYQITFNTNGGSNINTKYVEEGSFVSKPFDPKKENAIFDGWYLNDELYDFEKPISDNITLVARWKNIYTITYDTNGGSFIPPRKVLDGEIIYHPGIPTKEDYIFLGWYLDDEEYLFNQPISDNITLVAKWDVMYYYINFVTNCEQIIDPIKVYNGSKANKPADPELKNHTFIGWYLNDKEFNFNDNITSNLTLIAKWKIDHKVTFHFNNGDNDLVLYSKDKAPLSNLFIFSEPVREGYAFVNYCLDEELTIEIFNYNTPVKSDMDIYILWSKYYQITYHLDGGVCENLIEKYTLNDTQNVSLVLNTPKKEGYYFRGYYQSNSFSGERVYQIEKGVTKDIELFAKWEEATLENAYIGFLGDSISTYKGYIPQGYVHFGGYESMNVSQTWWKMTQEELGCKLGINNSYSGTCVLKKYGSGGVSGETIARLQKCLRYDKIVPDILVVYMGMNDCLVDPNNVTVDEFKTSYENMINNIYLLYPDVQLFVCTIGFEVNYQNKSNLDKHLAQKEAFNQVIIECAKNHGISIIDFANAYDSKDYLMDTVHPNALGMIELSKIAVKTIKEYFEN